MKVQSQNYTPAILSNSQTHAKAEHKQTSNSSASSMFSSGKEKQEKGVFARMLNWATSLLRRIFCCDARSDALRSYMKDHKEIRIAENLIQRQYPHNCSLKSFPKSIQEKVALEMGENPKITEETALKQVIQREKALNYKQLVEVAKELDDHSLIYTFGKFNAKDQITYFGENDHAKQLEYKALSVLGKKIEENRSKSFVKKHWDHLVTSQDGYAKIAKKYLNEVIYSYPVRKEAAEFIRGNIEAIKEATFA